MHKIINSFPITGLKSMALSPSGILFGDAQSGNIYSLNGKVITLIAQTGDNLPVDNLITFSNSSSSLFSVGGKLNLLIGQDVLANLSNSVSTGNTMAIMDLGDEKITDIIQDKDTKAVILSTDQGRIISCEQETINAYLTGNRAIYADVRDGFGLFGSTSTSILYALYHRIAEINTSKEIVKWKYSVSSSAILEETMTGIFLSPILNANNDFGFWKEIIWNEVKPGGTQIVISLRAADSPSALLQQEWKYAFTSNIGETSPVTRELNAIPLKGQYLQMKVEMITSRNNVTPVVSQITLNYSTKQAVYFFTTRFSLAKDSDTTTGFITASMTEPQNTEVIFGMATKNTNDWNDFQVIEPDKLFTMTNPESLKVGIKFVSYDGIGIPEVAEFALSAGSKNKEIL